MPFEICANKVTLIWLCTITFLKSLAIKRACTHLKAPTHIPRWHEMLVVLTTKEAVQKHVTLLTRYLNLIGAAKKCHWCGIFKAFPSVTLILIAEDLKYRSFKFEHLTNRIDLYLYNIGFWLKQVGTHRVQTGTTFPKRYTSQQSSVGKKSSSDSSYTRRCSKKVQKMAHRGFPL